MAMPKVSGVYRIEIGPHFYIGRSVHVERRLAKHLSELRNGCHGNSRMQRTYDKYGDLSFEILEECLPEETPKVEAAYLIGLDSDPFCMNLVVADENGRTKLTPAQRLQLSESRKGKVKSLEHRQKLAEAQRGKVFSKESRLKMSLAAKGRVRSEETKAKGAAACCKPCVLYMPSGDPLLFDSVKEVGEFFSFKCCSVITKYLKGKYPWPTGRSLSPLSGWTGEYLPKKRFACV